MSRIIIIGGMGPQASLELHKRLLKAAVIHGAVKNDDYPEIVHLSIPVPDFIDGGDSAPALNMLKRSLQAVFCQPDDVAVIACNTVHLLLPQLRTVCEAEFVSLLEMAVLAASSAGLKQVGLVASPATIQSGLYSSLLGKAGVRTLTPLKKELRIVEKAIRGIIAGDEPAQFKASMQPIIDRLLKRGAEKVILGCTELSVIYANDDATCLIDPLKEVSKRLVEV